LEEGDANMAEELVKCPKESDIMYQREICENIFRKSDIRCWCKTCEIFSEEEERAKPN
jgi:hypothetical protein